MEGAEDGENQSGEEAIRVFVRIRPLNKRELAEHQTIGWNFNDTSMLEDTQNGQRVYAYDRCYAPSANNTDVYELVGKPVVLKAMEGYNGTVFTYGQTGSGKTFTMRGSESDPGMMILCIRDIFDWIESHPQTEYSLRVSYMEVYNEEINDLLGEGVASKNLRIVSEDAVRGAVIGGLTEELVRSPQELLEVLRRGEFNRSYGSTIMNAESSRSHTIYRLAIEAKDVDNSGGDSVDANGFQIQGGAATVARVSFMNLVDLAGSERQKSTGASGKTLKEGANINKSLLALGAVINKLGEASKKAKGAKPVFIPYRDSKLTRILKQSLGGNTMTSILCTVTPAPMHREETVSTLKFGQLCKTIKNSVKSNEIMDDRALIKQYRNIIAELKAELAEYKDRERTGSACEEDDSATPSDNAKLRQLQQEKSELEARVQSLELLVLRGSSTSAPDGTAPANTSLATPRMDGATGDNDNSGIAEALASAQASNAALLETLQESKLEVRKLQTKVNSLEQHLASLQSEIEEAHEFEEMKSAFEEYQRESQSEMDEERVRLESEKATLQAERIRTMGERTHLDEKEARLGLLLAALDERDSKLRQHLAQLQEQQNHWQQSVIDLTRREELVEDWQQNHRHRENKLKEWDAQLDAKFTELNQRESKLAELEQAHKVQQRELGEREQRLQVALSRVANSEQTVAALQEKLSAQETREGEMDTKEKEIVFRRRELDSWDALLREKDKKVVAEQRHLDERDEMVRVSEERVRAKELDVEKRSTELRHKETEATLLVEKYSQQMSDLERREKTCGEQLAKYNSWEKELIAKESSLSSLESYLKDLQVRYKDTEKRETEVEKKIQQHQKAVDRFYNMEVAQITVRHAREIKTLESTIERQLEVGRNYQREIDNLRSRLSEREQSMAEHEKLLSESAAQLEEVTERALDLNKALETLQQEMETLKDENDKLKRQKSLPFRDGPDSDEDVPAQSMRSRNRQHLDDDQLYVSQIRVNIAPKYNAIKNSMLIQQLADTRNLLKSVLNAHEETTKKAHSSPPKPVTHRFIDRSISNISDFSFDSNAGEHVEEIGEPMPPVLATIQESSEIASVDTQPVRSTPPSGGQNRDQFNASALMSTTQLSPPSDLFSPVMQSTRQQSSQRRQAVTNHRPAAITPTKPAFQINTSKASTPQSSSKRNGYVTRSVDKNNVPVATVSLSLHKSQNSRLASTTKYVSNKN